MAKAGHIEPFEMKNVKKKNKTQPTKFPHRPKNTVEGNKSHKGVVRVAPGLADHK